MKRVSYLQKKRIFGRPRKQVSRTSLGKKEKSLNCNVEAKSLHQLLASLNFSLRLAKSEIGEDDDKQKACL